jgi:hypothetical protein
MFKYIFIPANDSKPIEEREGDGGKSAFVLFYDMYSCVQYELMVI